MGTQTRRHMRTRKYEGWRERRAVQGDARTMETDHAPPREFGVKGRYPEHSWAMTWLELIDCLASVRPLHLR